MQKKNAYIAIIVIDLDSKKVNHKRVTYGLLDLLKDVGGLYNVLHSVAIILMINFTRYNEILSLISCLYIAITKDDKLLKSKSQKIKIDKRFNHINYMNHN